MTLSHTQVQIQRPIWTVILSCDKHLSTQEELDPTATALFAKVKCGGVLAKERGHCLHKATHFCGRLPVPTGIFAYRAELWRLH